MMKQLPDHPEIELALRTGYPSCSKEGETQEEYDEDALYEERRERDLW